MSWFKVAPPVIFYKKRAGPKLKEFGHEFKWAGIKWDPKSPQQVLIEELACRPRL